MQPLVEYTHKNRKSIRGKETLSSEAEKTVKMLIITLGIMILVLTGVFMGLTNSSAQKGYTLQQVKLQNEALIDENNMIKAKLTSDASMTSLDENQGIEDMQNMEEKQYITSEDNIVK